MDVDMMEAEEEAVAVVEGVWHPLLLIFLLLSLLVKEEEEPRSDLSSPLQDEIG